jgi:hypothetical protein
MTERPQDAMMATPSGKPIDIGEDRTVLGVTSPPRLNAVPPPTGPVLGDFLAGQETRLRDLLAFAMAVEAGRPMPADGLDTLRRRADADLESYAFRVLHNQVEAIRRQAVDEQVGRVRRGLSFPATVVANLVALAIGGIAVLVASRIDPGFFTRLADQLAQLVAQLTARF